MPTNKWILTSKTFWTNLIGGVLTLLSIPEISSLIPPKYTPYIVAATAILNVVFRSLKTDAQGGLSLTPQPPTPVEPILPVK